jgi:hypothetical protein
MSSAPAVKARHERAPALATYDGATELERGLDILIS